MWFLPQIEWRKYLIPCLISGCIFPQNPILAAPKAPCPTEIYEKLIEEQINSVPSREAVERIDAIYADPSLEPKAKAIAAFDSFLEDKLRNLEPDERERVWSVYQNIKPKIIKKGFRAHMLAHNGHKIHVKITGKHLETEIYFRLLAHELHHALQLTMLEDIPAFKRWVNEFANITHNRFLREKGAQLSELEYLRMLPEERRSELIAEIEKDNLISDSDKKLLITELLNADKSPDEFLEIVWSEHPWTNSPKMTGQLAGAIWIYAVLLGTVGGLTVAQSICKRMRQNPNINLEESSFYQHVCRKMRH